MCDNSEHSPWICHVCDATSTSESTACSVCYKTTCDLHLKHVSVFNKESGLYEIVPICVHCAASEVIR